jgi:uncharacterized membrane protein
MRPALGMAVLSEQKGGSVTFAHVMEWITRGFEVLGVAVFVVGTAWAFVRVVVLSIQGRPLEGYDALRRTLGRVIVLGLEILIIADIIRTITIDLTWQSVLSLGLIVLVRTFLSFALEIELDGVVPWRRAELRRRVGAPVGTGTGTAGTRSDRDDPQDPQT